MTVWSTSTPPLEPNSDIVIEASTQGEAAVCTLEQLDEYSSSDMKVIVNGRIVRCPKCLEVNGSLELPSYEIKEGDAVETRSFLYRGAAGGIYGCGSGYGS